MTLAYPWLEPDDVRACLTYARRVVGQGQTGRADYRYGTLGYRFGKGSPRYLDRRLTLDPCLDHPSGKQIEKTVRVDSCGFHRSSVPPLCLISR